MQAKKIDNSASTAPPNRVRRPYLPRPLAAPFSLLPDSLHSRLLVTVLNTALGSAVVEGDLDFLKGRCVAIRIRDIGINFRLSLTGNRLVAGQRSGAADLTIEGELYDFLLLIDRQEDPDTLVFQRRLVVEGDTELGLQVKNFLDGLDGESSGWYAPPAAILRKALPLYARLFG